MATIEFSWKITSAPSDEAEQVRYRQSSGNYFKIHISVFTQIICFVPQPHDQQPAATIIPTKATSRPIDRTVFLSSAQLLENGSSHVRALFSRSVVPDGLIEKMMPEVTEYSRNLIDNYAPHSGGDNNSFRLFKLNLDVAVQKPYDDVIDMIWGEYSRMLIDETLRKVKIGKGYGGGRERCGGCLAELVEGTEASAMPCKHVYHRECITWWLERSFTCPMCRCGPTLTRANDLLA